MGRNLPGFGFLYIRTMFGQMHCIQSRSYYRDKRKLYYKKSDGEFETRFNNHSSLFRHKRYSTNTELSKNIWKVSKEKIQYEIKWNIAAYTLAHKCGSRRCGLCLTEKLKIMREGPELLLNKRSELVFKCRHKNKFILANIN